MHAHEDGATVGVFEDGGGIVEDTPARHHIKFIAVMLDMADGVGRRGGGVRTGVVEVRCSGTEGVDFLVKEVDGGLMI